MACLEESTRIVQLKVRLLGLSPMIWRRVLVPESVSLRELHGILQVSMVVNDNYFGRRQV